MFGSSVLAFSDHTFVFSASRFERLILYLKKKHSIWLFSDYFMINFCGESKFVNDKKIHLKANQAVKEVLWLRR